MFRRTLTDIGAGVALAAAGVLATGAAAYAHECYNASRSEQGNAGASNSQVWFTLNVTDALAGDVASGFITPTQAECIFDAYTAGGGPASFTIMIKGANGQGGTIGANNPNDWHATDNHGIDHFFDAYGGLIFGSYEQCGASFPV